MSSIDVFHRTVLAEKMTRQVLMTGAGVAASSGLFLSAPRRTGKSTFLREDLRPALQAHGALVLYVDLWADKKADPGQVIVDAIRAELAKHDGVLLRLARGTGMDRVSLGGTAFDLSRVGLGVGVSLSVALSALSHEVKKTIVLIIDEAQHAITTDNGYDALFALKAARDEINSSEHDGLRIVATGSNRDKLAMLRNSKDQAFFGAPLVSFPPLGRDYIEWFCREVKLDAPLDPDKVEALFVRADCRPEILNAAVNAVRFDFDLLDTDVMRKFEESVMLQIQESESQSLRVIHALTPLQSAVLRVLVASGDAYAPFESSTMFLYKKTLRSISPDDTVCADVPNVQQALGALQDKALIWKERRGVYALEESSLAGLLQKNGLLGCVEFPASDSDMARPTL